MSSTRKPHRPVNASCVTRRQFLHSSVLGLGALLGGVARAEDSPAASILRIGFCGPFNGPAQDTGIEIRRGVLMALMDARADGEIPVLLAGRRHDIQPVWIDSASNPDAAVTAFEQAMDEGPLSLMVGGWHSDVALALMDAEAAREILHLGHLGEAQAIADRLNQDYARYRGWFKGWPSPGLLAARYGEPLQYLRDQGLWRPVNNRAAIVAEDSAYGRGWSEALSASLRASGFSVAAPDLTALDAADFTPLLRRYREQGISLVAMTTTGIQAGARFVRQFREQQLDALLLGHGLRWTRDWYAYTGSSSDYVISMDSAMPIALWQQWWVRRYRSLFSDMPSIAAAGLHYDYTRMAVRMLNATSSLALDDLIRTLYRSPYRGVWNRYQFSSKPHPRARSPNEVITGSFMEGFFFPLAQLHNGEAHVVWPPRYADQRFMVPATANP
ncbi:ABC transporter substrate-binding protein [Marinobacterium rhizophilum]|uniref:ABC transporter substrate-binding protein n=1 Tax=Marinobacterium rhizophilum TaxID=420402 RepID=A0ABY5HLQ8_9GAMM|nr:ABC transporter substrate-binding protein [Marinobacterium rhizophilum]UTW12899.1 ABC transporter substrate-binding protein [Marinobacterium rhizophilum]